MKNLSTLIFVTIICIVVILLGALIGYNNSVTRRTSKTPQEVYYKEHTYLIFYTSDITVAGVIHSESCNNPKHK